MQSLVSRLKRVQAFVSGKLKAAVANMERQANRKRHDVRFTIGQQVLVYKEGIKPPEVRAVFENSNKLEPRGYGPFKVIAQVGDNAYQLDFPDGVRTHNVINVKFLQPFIQPEDEERRLERPAVVDADGEVAYEVEAIRQHRCTRRGPSRNPGRLKFLVCWAGFPTERTSWEPAENLKHAQTLVEEYLKTLTREEREVVRAHPDMLAVNK